MSTNEKNIYEILNYNCLLYCKRIIFKYKGRYFYKSTGINSNISGMIFPFYGIKEYKQKRIWFIKPKSGNIINTLKKIIKNVKEDMWINSDWNKRFNNFRQMYVSYKYGHKFWESKTGLYIAEYFGFDNSVYNTLKIPENIIKIKNPKNVNKWLKYRE